MVALRDRSVNLPRRGLLGTLIGSRWAPLALIVGLAGLGQQLDLESWASREFPSRAVPVAAAEANIINDVIEVIKDWLDPDPEPEPAPTPPPEEGEGGW